MDRGCLLSVLLTAVLISGCSGNQCPDPQACLSQGSELYQKAETSKDKIEKFSSYKEACSKFFSVFKEKPGLFGAEQYKEAKWACFNCGNGAKTEALANAEEAYQTKLRTEKNKPKK